MLLMCDDCLSNVPLCATHTEAPRALHLTKSAYIRHIAPNVSSGDILEVRHTVCSVLAVMLLLTGLQAVPRIPADGLGWTRF